MVREADFDKEDNITQRLIDRIKKSDRKEIELELFPEIRKSPLNDFNREMLVKAVQERVGVISGVKPSITHVRKELKPKVAKVEVINGDVKDKKEIPWWCEDWVYINASSAYMNINNKKLYKSEAFNLECGRYIFENDNGHKQSATKVVSDQGFVDVVQRIEYLPHRIVTGKRF